MVTKREKELRKRNGRGLLEKCKRKREKRGRC